jgi:hypothetical protein
MMLPSEIKKGHLLFSRAPPAHINKNTTMCDLHFAVMTDEKLYIEGV